MLGDIEGVLVSRTAISEKTKDLGKRISEDYKGEDIILIGVLKGAFIFLADLMREITIPVDMDLISVTSYGNETESTGVVRIIKDTDVNVDNKHVLIVEDLVDTGLTLNHLVQLFKTRRPKSVKTCTAFDKPSRRKVDIHIDYEGIVVPDEFIVGYGLDYAGKYRNLPDVCTLKPEVIKAK